MKGGEERRGRRDNGSRGKKGEKEREKGLLQEMLERREEGGRREGGGKTDEQKAKGERREVVDEERGREERKGRATGRVCKIKKEGKANKQRKSKPLKSQEGKRQKNKKTFAQIETPDIYLKSLQLYSSPAKFLVVQPRGITRFDPLTGSKITKF